MSITGESKSASRPNPALFQVLGITDEVTVCDCCGKSPLKSTYIVQMIESGEILHYGSTCVCRNTGKPLRIVKAEIQGAEAAKLEAARIEWERNPERVAMESRISEAHRRNLPPGMEFARFVNSAPAGEAKAEIAARHGVPVWRLT